jgi:hypothetical protein
MSPPVDGCRTLGEWVAWKLDMSQQRARRIVRTMKRSADRPELRQALASGVSFDRVEALARIEENVGLWEGMSVGAIHREATRRAGSQSDMFRGPDDRFLVMQPSLDEGWYKFYGGLDGPAGAIVDKVLSQAADRIQERSEGVTTTASWRKATALAELCVSDQPMPAQVTVFVDAKHAASANGASGIVLDSGPRSVHRSPGDPLRIGDRGGRQGRRRPIHGLRPKPEDGHPQPSPGPDGPAHRDVRNRRL